MFDILFNKWLDCCLFAAVVRMLIFVNMGQIAYTGWGGIYSRLFHIKNGTRQGAMLSYCDDLNKELRALGVGCYIAGTFMVVTCYHNYMLLLSPTLSDMAALMAVCERYVRTITKIVPMKSKTKCLYMCGDKNRRDYPECLHLNGRKLPFVSSATNLGHTLRQDCTMDLY